MEATERNQGLLSYIGKKHEVIGRQLDEEGETFLTGGVAAAAADGDGVQLLQQTDDHPGLAPLEASCTDGCKAEEEKVLP